MSGPERLRQTLRRATDPGAWSDSYGLARVRPARSPIQGWHLRYGFALATVALAWISREGLLPGAGDRSPFLAFGLAVMITALVAGFGPALLATVLCAAVAAVLHLPPQLAIDLHEPFDAVRVGLFAVEGVAAAIAGGLVRRAVLREEARERSTDRFARIVHQAERLRRQQPSPDHAGIGGLTEREVEVARLLALGYSNDEIAATLFVTRNTVKTHLKHIYEKLAVNTRTEAVVRCIELGLFPRSPARGPSSKTHRRPNHVEPDSVDAEAVRQSAHSNRIV